MRFSRSALILVASLLIVGGIAYWYFGGSRRKMAQPPPVESVLPKEFLAALRQQKEGKPVAAATKAPAAVPAASSIQSATTKFTANGRNQLHVVAPNATDRALRFMLHAGEIYESGGSQIVLLEDCDRMIPARGVLETDLKAAAVTLESASSNDACVKSTAVIPKLDLLLAQLKAQPDISPGVLQTAILTLAQNPAVDVFAKFPRLHGVAGGNDDLKVDVADIIAALQMLNEIGVNDRILASDPQLKLEAMLDPASHDSAMRFYGISPDLEWAYWKHELLEGDPSIRHYALYGIARYYPDVALQMLPKWARMANLQPIYRLSAVKAMAVTHRPEAIPILQKLEQEFGPGTDLQQSAGRATKYLSTQFNKPS